MSVFKQLSKLPPDHYLTLCVEPDEDSKHVLQLVAYIFQRAPEGGWPSWGAYFDHPPGAATHRQPPEHLKLEDAVRVAVNVALREDGDDSKTRKQFRGLVEDMLDRYIAKMEAGSR